MLLFIVIFCVIIALGFGLAAAYSDFKGMTIPNLYPGFIILSFVPAFIAVQIFTPESAYFSSWISHLVSLAVVFGITYALFATKAFGGGDAKLCSAFALWVGVQGLAPFLFFMGVVGGSLGLLTLALGKHKPIKAPVKGSWIDKAQSGAKEVPYGIAITTGAFAAFFYAGYLSPEGVTALIQTAVGE
jgi:prepilin peptidase CpaA